MIRQDRRGGGAEELAVEALGFIASDAERLSDLAETKKQDRKES